MNSVTYIGRNNNIHDQRFVKVLSKKFKVLEIYTQDIGSKPIPIDLFADVSLIVAGPLTDAISAIPIGLKLPILGISHAFDVNMEFNDPAIKENIARCAAIISDCEHITKILRGTYNFTKKIHEVPWGCDRHFFSKAKIQFDNKLKILVTRNWFPMYQNNVIVNALKIIELRKLDFSCTFIGDGPQLDDQRQLLTKMPETLDIQFLGHQTKANIRHAMSDNWIYISAASSDGTSISLLEAMAAGMICITTDFPSNKEWIEHSISGFLFPNGDSEALALLIEHISSLSEEEKKDISRKAKEKIRSRGDWKNNEQIFISAVIDTA
jgi:glycosyltransferase involved in cell wall biosynthesis